MRQDADISNLTASIEMLHAEIDSLTNTIEWGGGYNYLAIGNSITKHPIGSYWWQEDGMAASKAEKDYFHLVVAWLELNYPDVKAFAYNAAAWEIQTNDRSEVLSVWDSYLSEELDLVTLQLSENIADTITFKSDFKEMVEYVIENCPNAQIIVIDDFWSEEKSELKKKVVDELNAEGHIVEFVDLSRIRGVNKYMAGIGTKVYDDEGNIHTIEHSGVAKHPGDLGMLQYAMYITELINK